MQRLAVGNTALLNGGGHAAELAEASVTQAMALTTPFTARAAVGRPRSSLAAARVAIWMNPQREARRANLPAWSFFLSEK